MTLSAQAPEFKAIVQSWIVKHGEVLAEFTFSGCGGRRSYEFFRTREAFDCRVKSLPGLTAVVAACGIRLPLRGVVDEAFIQEAERKLVEGEDWLLVPLAHDVPREGHSAVEYSCGDTHEELRDELEDVRGSRIAVGVDPKWYVRSDDIVVAIVPSHDGTLVGGSY